MTPTERHARVLAEALRRLEAIRVRPIRAIRHLARLESDDDRTAELRALIEQAERHAPMYQKHPLLKCWSCRWCMCAETPREESGLAVPQQWPCADFLSCERAMGFGGVE